MSNLASPSVYRPALSTFRLRGFTSEEVIQLADRRAFVGIEWSETHVRLGDRKRAMNVRAATQKQGLSIVAYTSFWNPARGAIAEAIDIANLLGAHTIRLDATGLLTKRENEEPLGHLRKALDQAHNAGISLSLSYLPSGFPMACRLARQVDHSAMRLYWRAPSRLAEQNRPDDLAGYRFYVPDVSVEEVTIRARRQAYASVNPEWDLDRSSLRGRFAIFDLHSPRINPASKSRSPRESISSAAA